MKRSFDIVISVLMGAVLLPLMVIVAVAIRIRLGSPVVFTQERPGRAGKLFKLRKFRSMADLKDEQGRDLPDSERITRFGSFLRSSSLDELPELWNVIRGEMSLVGPRPLLPEYLPLYSEEQSRRHEVRPGLTGWAQVNGRNALSWEERFEMDVWYVDNRNFTLDLKIIWMTIWTILSRKDVSAEGRVSMPPFTEKKEEA
jgi:lipopolysaccharide/colanic/teichoic acid biosynthesis glycosyltransferase